jgi:hypothetical protein
MKTLLLFSLICLALSATVTIPDDLKGPAVNPKHYESYTFCSHLNAWQDDDWLDNDSIRVVPTGVSDCVDSLLWDGDKGIYYDRCCYLRLQLNGVMHGGCIGLREEQYLDITETIIRLENGDKNILTSEAKGAKVYQLDCSSSYLSLLSFATILLALIF